MHGAQPRELRLLVLLPTHPASSYMYKTTIPLRRLEDRRLPASQKNTCKQETKDGVKVAISDVSLRTWSCTFVSYVPSKGCNLTQ